MDQVFNVLVVDDEKDYTRGISRLISRRFGNVDILEAHDSDAALRMMGERNVHLLLTDLRMPGKSGMSLLKEALAAYPRLSAVMLTAFGDIDTAVEAVRSGAYDFLTKPVEPDRLFHVVERGLERARLLEENDRLKRMLDAREGQDEEWAMVGESTAMRRLRQSVVAVAQSDYTVLVRGESGTGKELAARMIHISSRRREKPFIAVNCPAIPANLLESELFGHVKGAFTGADRDRDGLFLAADGGTLHLDEIGDIPMETQTKLLRCLQEQEVRPVGANKSIKVDVRVVASTNRDLEQMIGEYAFREDLYYRLNVLNLTIPALRERSEDIPLLSRFFLRRAGSEMGMPDKEIAPEVLAWLASRQWPGNVRELQNFMRRLTVFCTGDEVTMDTVRLVEQGPGADEPAQGIAPYKVAKAALVDEFTQGYIAELLTSTGGNISEAARLSGLSRVALQKILTRLSIDVSEYRR